MQSGMIFGIFWCISFLLLVSNNPALRVFASPLILATPFVGFILAHKFKRDVRNDGDVSYFRAFHFCILLYLYATAILAIVAYFYFRFFDHGEFVQRNLEVLALPETKALFENARMEENGITMSDLEAAIKSINPITVTASIINVNVLLSIPMALITAFIAMTKRTKREIL